MLLVLLALSASASAYNITYVSRDYVETPNCNVTAPSVYWPFKCQTNIRLYASATNTGSYVLTSSYYSPDYSLMATATKYRDNPITCQIQNAEELTSSISNNDFYEATTKTEYTSSVIDTWLNVTYVCEPDSSDYFIYSNTEGVDSYGNHPYGYGKKFTTCFAQSPSQCSNLLQSDLNNIIQYLKDGYYEQCGSDIRIDAEGESYSGNSLGISSDLSMNYWTMIPFNSMGSGIVNISIWQTAFYFSGSGNCGASFGTNHRYYLWDTVTNTTEDLGTTFPLNIYKNLIPYRDYWLFIGSRYYCDSYNFGSLQINHNYTNYNVSIFAYDPEWLCSDWSSCVEGFESRTCYDANGRVPDKVEEKACFVKPAVDIELGFEDFYYQDIYICQKDYWLVTCTQRLETIQAKYPKNWTVIGTDISGANLENFLTISQDWASKGSSSIKMWYYPPKNEEPVAPTPVCGNATTGRFAQITTDYNESLFISRNVSFASPYIQLRYDVKKCALPVVQYDYGTWFACGKKCYSNNCTQEPLGRYGIRITDYSSYISNVDSLFNFSNQAGTDYTAQIKNTSSETQILHNNLNYYGNMTLEGKYFTNGTIINIYYRSPYSASYNVSLKSNDLGETYASFKNTGSTSQWANVTLGNVQGDVSTIILTNGTTGAVQSFAFYYKYIEILIPTNYTYTKVIFDYFDNAKLDKQNKILDFSALGLKTNHNYTLAIAVNPENVFDPNAHCIYLDDFSITFTDVELPSCESYCDGLTYYSSYFVQDGVCAFSIIPVSSNCITDNNLQDAIENNDNFEYEDQYYVWNNETGEWEIVEVPALSPQEAQQLSLYSPPIFVQEILIGYGITESAFGYVWFFFSLFMLINYVALGIGIGVTVFLIPLTSTNNPQVSGGTDKTFVPFMIVVIMIIVGATFSGWYPLEIGIPIIVAIGLMLWKTMENVIGGGR